jgi:hypothetical protein
VNGFMVALNREDRCDYGTRKFDLVGFVSAAGEGLDSFTYASRADCIQADGTIAG